MIDHVAYTVVDPEDPDLAAMMTLLGFQQFQASESYEATFMRGQYRATWWCNGGSTDVHLVAGEAPADRGLEHLCVMGVGEDTFESLKDHPACVRESGTGRLWLEAMGLRIEVHP